MSVDYPLEPHVPRIARDGYAARWVCTCGWSTQWRDHTGVQIPGAARAAIAHHRHADTPAQPPQQEE